MQRVVEEPLGMHFLVQVAIPLEVGEKVEIVLATLIPVTANIGLSAVQAGYNSVKPVVHFYLTAVDGLESVAVNVARLYHEFTA